MNAWGDHIRRFRRAQGMTQAAFAEVMGVEQATVSRWERGTHSPELSIQRRLRDFLSRSYVVADSMIVHRVRFSLSAMKLADRRGRNAAVSSAAASLHGLDEGRLSHFDYSHLFTDVLNEQWSLAHRIGFFLGDVASIHVFNPWRPAGGGPLRFCEGAWTPVFLSDGEAMLISEFREIDQSSYEDIPPADRVSVVTLDEIVTC